MTRVAPSRPSPLILRALRAAAPALDPRVRIPLLARAFNLPKRAVARYVGGGR